MLPRLAADPNYLSRRGYEVTTVGGRLVVRQPPGEDNALGRIALHVSQRTCRLPARHAFASAVRVRHARLQPWLRAGRGPAAARRTGARVAGKSESTRRSADRNERSSCRARCRSTSNISPSSSTSTANCRKGRTSTGWRKKSPTYRPACVKIEMLTLSVYRRFKAVYGFVWPGGHRVRSVGHYARRSGPGPNAAAGGNAGMRELAGYAHGCPRSGGEVASAAFRKDDVGGLSLPRETSAGSEGLPREPPWRRSCIAAWLAPNSTESAVANGDTRTITFSNSHTNESGSFTYMVNGVYDQADARQAQLVPARLAAQRADQDGPPPLRHHLGGLSRIRLAAADRRSLRLSFAADQRHAAPALAPGRRTFPAHGRPRDRRAFRRRRDRAHSRHRDAHAGRRRRLLSHRLDALGSYRQRFGALLAAHEPRRACAAFPRRQDGFHSLRRPADAGLRAGRARRSSSAAARSRPPAAAACSPGCSARAAAATTTPKRAAARRPWPGAAEEGPRRRRFRSPTRGPKPSPKPNATCQRAGLTPAPRPLRLRRSRRFRSPTQDPKLSPRPSATCRRARPTPALPPPRRRLRPLPNRRSWPRWSSLTSRPTRRPRPRSSCTVRSRHSISRRCRRAAPSISINRSLR